MFPAPFRPLMVNANVGGNATMNLHLRRALDEHPDAEPSYLDVPPPDLARKLVAAPIPGLARLDLDLQPLRLELAQSLALRARLRAWSKPFDVLHVYGGDLALLSVADLRRVPSVVSTDCTMTQNHPQLPYRHPTRFTGVGLRVSRLFENRVYEAATLVVAQSRWTARSLRDTYGVPDDKVRVVPFGISFDAAERRPPEGLPEVTFIGTTMSRKGGWLLLDAYRRSLTGRCVLNLVTRERVEPPPGVRVFNDFAPGDRRLPELLARTAVLAFPSEIDKFGYAVLEAMAAGVPVLALRGVGALDEIVEDGVTGVLVDHSQDALAAGIGDLLADQVRREQMGEAARRRFNERFHARITTAQLVDVFLEARGRERTVVRR